MSIFYFKRLTLKMKTILLKTDLVLRVCSSQTSAYKENCQQPTMKSMLQQNSDSNSDSDSDSDGDSNSDSDSNSDNNSDSDSNSDNNYSNSNRVSNDTKNE